VSVGPATRFAALPDPFQFWRGGSLSDGRIAYETWGTLNAARDNAILLFTGLSPSAHAASSEADPSMGWWEKMIGPRKAIDTDRYFVIGTNSLGGCQGTTGPASLAPDGKLYQTRFPAVTVGDMVEVQCRLMDHLGIDKLRNVCGGSMGGMQALEWTVRKPNRVKSAFVTASCAAHSAMQIGFNEAARQAVMRDAKWNGGNYDPAVAAISVVKMVLVIVVLLALERVFGLQRLLLPPIRKGGAA
jgi:homoserine O-acetyltransferase